MDIGTEIYDLSLLCDESFLRVTKNQEAPSYVVAEVLHQRFQQWASNMGVFAQEQLSLDARLAYSESLRSIVLQLLQIAKTSLDRVGIESPEGAARETQSSVIEQMSRKPGQLSSLLIESLQALESAVDGLHRLGAAIQQSSSAERLTQRIHNFIQKKNDGVLEDIVYARLKYQLVDKAKEDEAQTDGIKGAALSLCRQLAVSVSYRYFSILYRRSHEDKKGIGRKRKPVEEQKDLPVDAVPKPAAPQDRPIKNLTPIPPHLQKLAPEGSESAPTLPNSTVARKKYASSQRSSIGAKSVVSIQPKDVKFPEPPKIIPPEIYAPCPYCRQQFGKSEYEKKGWWKHHLQSDLKPYTCISEECHDPPQLFARFEEWKSHMDKEHTPRWTVQAHMPVSWCCELDHDEEWFNEEQAFEDHVKDHHHEYSSDSELADLKELSMVRQPRQIYSCPVCNCIPEKIEVIISKAPELLTQERQDLRKELLNHVAQHLMQIGFLTIAYLDDETVGDSEASRNVSGRVGENHDWVRPAKWVEGSWVFDDAGLSTYWDSQFAGLESEPVTDAKPPDEEEDWKYVWESKKFNGRPYSLEQTSRQVIEFAKEWRTSLDTLGCLKAFADWLFDNNRLEEAEEVYLQRYELCARVLGDGNAATVESLEAVTNVMELRGKFEMAETRSVYPMLARRHHDTVIDVYGDDGYGYTTPGDLAQYDLDRAAKYPSRRRKNSEGSKVLRPLSPITRSFGARERVPPPSTQGFDQLAPVSYDLAPFRMPDTSVEPVLIFAPEENFYETRSMRKNFSRRPRREEPKKAEEEPVKGILRQPRDKFPEDLMQVWEGVWPLKDAKKDGIPPFARWTKISRRLVNPEALDLGRERYEARDDFVIVLRVLSKEEVQCYAEATAKLRAARDAMKARGDERRRSA